MAIMKTVQLQNNFTMIPNETIKRVHNDMGAVAFMILVDVTSYSETWEIHKTELYRRYAKHKESSVRNGWNELIDLGYVVEFKYRSGKKWEYVYYIRLLPFSPEEKAQILDTARVEFGEIWGLDFQDLKMKTSKPRDNKEKGNKEKPKKNKSINNKGNSIDDDKRTSPSEEDSALKHTHDEQDIQSTISLFQEKTQNLLSKRSFDAIVRKVMDKYNQGKVESFRDYLASAITNKIEELDARRELERKRTGLSEVTPDQTERKREQDLFYNWLDERE